MYLLTHLCATYLPTFVYLHTAVYLPLRTYVCAERKRNLTSALKSPNLSFAKCESDGSSWRKIQFKVLEIKFKCSLLLLCFLFDV